MLLYSLHTIFRRLKHCISIPYISCVLALFLLQSCGFELRGALDLSSDISPVYFQQNTAFELGREIKSILQTNRIAISEYANTANSRLIILKEGRSQRVLSVDSNGRAKEYLLIYTVQISIKIKEQVAIEDSISVSRSLLFDPEAVIAVNNTAEILYKDMKHDAARLILLKLQARSRNAAAIKPGDESIPVDKPADDKVSGPEYLKTD